MLESQGQLACEETAILVFNLSLFKIPSKTTSNQGFVSLLMSLNRLGTLKLSPPCQSPTLRGNGPTPYLIISFNISFCHCIQALFYAAILKAMLRVFSEGIRTTVLQ